MAGVIPVMWNQPAPANDRIPVDIARLGPRDGASVAVVDHFRGPLVGARFQVIDAQPPLAAHDVRRVHAEAAQFADRRIGDGILIRQRGDERGRKPEHRQRDGDVGLSSAECGHELRALQKPLESRRRQPQHDLPEGNRSVWHKLEGT